MVDELRAYLRCGIFAHGFSRVACLSCGRDEALPFSCKNRFVCPSCCARRMYDTAAHLVDRVLPQAPFRQWVLSYPFALRLALARDLLAAQRSQRIFIEEVFRWQRAAARRAGIPGGQPAAVACTQRFGSSLNLNVHHHTVLPDGVFTRDADGVFRPGLPARIRPGVFAWNPAGRRRASTPPGDPGGRSEVSSVESSARLRASRSTASR